MTRRRYYRMTQEQALTVLCSLMFSISCYLSDAWQAPTAGRMLYCVRMASENLDAYSLICSRYGWTDGKRALVQHWRNDLAQLAVNAKRLQADVQDKPVTQDDIIANGPQAWAINRYGNTCQECGIPFTQPSPDCPHMLTNVHPR